jgi:trimeric autotransporter adhesin
MKNIFLFLICLCAIQLQAQVTMNIGSGAHFVVSGSTNVVMDTGNFVNNGNYTDSTGLFKAAGGVAFSGSGTTRLHNLNVSNAQTTNVNATVSVFNTATLTGGNLNANNNLYIRSDDNTTANMVVTGVLNNTVRGIIERATVTSSTGCTPYTSDLTLNISGPAMVYQWQSSADSATWSDIAGATAATYTASVTATAWYRCNLSTNNSAYGQATPGTKLIFVGSLPDITGANEVCAGSGIVLSNSLSGGTWSSSNPSTATVDETTGFVTGISAGVVTISYHVGSTCNTTHEVTVNTTPGSISGTLSVCISNTTTLSSSPSGGTWNSGNTARATVDAGTGIATGVSAGTVDITYTLAGGCRRKVTVTVNATPASITGTLTLCTGSTTTLGSAPSGGTWSSDATGVATVGAGTGIVTGVSTGTATISYTNGSCARSTVVTVNAAAGSNTGISLICAGQAATLSNTTPGGTWSSSDPATATVHASTGLVTGISSGLANITYTNSPGCFSVTEVTVNAAIPAITGVLTVCIGLTTELDNATSGGTWTSSNIARATIDASTGEVTGVSGGTVTISYVSSAACYTSSILTVNTAPAAITGTATVCEGLNTTLICSPSGGTWSSSGAAATVGSTGIVTGVSAGTVTISYTRLGCSSTRVVTVNVTPTAITGSLTVCVGSTSALGSTPSGGTWAVTFAGKATVNATTGLITGVAAGTTPVTYTAAGGCRTTSTVTVVTNPSAIGGTLTVCIGSNTTLTSATAGGTWSSSDDAVATVASGTGVVTGISTGTAAISYAKNGCSVSTVVTVNAALGANTGSPTVCIGQGTDLNNATAGGTWSSSNTGIATVNTSTGLVAGVSAGTVNISYRISAGCYSITVVTVNTALSSITGTASVCPGATTTLSHPDAGGVWSSSNIARATVGAGTGVVSGVAAGIVTISYTVGGCFITIIVTVNASPTAITGTASMCEGATATLSCGPTGGAWSSSATGTATVSGTGVVTGIAAGTATISYIRLGCSSTRVVTVTATPSSLTGTLTTCIGNTTTLASSPAGGTWTSSTISKATVGAGTGIVTGVSAGTATITYAMSATCRSTAVVTVIATPATISGILTVCATCNTSLSSATSGGTWSSSNTAAATINSSTGVVSAVGVGTTTISYTVSGCVRTTVVTVSPSITASFGTPVVCVGQTNSTLGNPTPGGTWSSSNTSLATINASTGVLTGVGIGNPNITYTTSPGVYTISVATVNAAVASITGTAAICPGATVALSNATSGGTWSSTITARATVDAGTGLVTGIAAGTTTISYTINVGCYKTTTQTINANPNVTGAASVVNGSSTAFGGSPGGGTWSSANSAIASVSVAGLVTGNSVAATTITYTLGTGCFSTRGINVLAARPGSPVTNNPELAGVLKVFPNPTSGNLIIEAPTTGSFTVYTIDGKEVAQYQVNTSSVTVSLPQHLAAGIYMCRFFGNDGTSAIVRLVFEQ